MVVNMSFALPVEKLRQTPLLLAFYHPVPSYPVHIIIVPRRSIDSLLTLGAEDAGFLIELIETVKSLVAELGLEAQGYRLIANGGAYQDFPLLHFHLVSGPAQIS
jgi:histidine triad (HIT) family protein